MKKGYIIFFLLPVFFILAFEYAGNTGYNKKQNSAASANTNTHAYPNVDREQLPVILATNYFCTSAASTPIQKIINSNESHFEGLNYSLRRVPSQVSVSEFLQQKKYLFYIYPSHNFW